MPLELERPRLELSGPRLKLAFETLVARADEEGGVEVYVEALEHKSNLFRSALTDVTSLDLRTVRTLCAHMATVRRRIGPYLEPTPFGALRLGIGELLDGSQDTSSTDFRMARFCASFPEDRPHRWVRDLAAEILHNADPQRYPLMNRWVWDSRANTGVLREIWHADDVDQIRIDISDRYETFLVLREELAQYLAANGVFRDVPYYVDLLTAHVYAEYIAERGGTYLRADFVTQENPMLHTRRILGLDGAMAPGRAGLTVADGEAPVAGETRRLH
jgi:hypothetical protein